jgi:hypothetical protein
MLHRKDVPLLATPLHSKVRVLFSLSANAVSAEFRRLACKCETASHLTLLILLLTRFVFVLFRPRPKLDGGFDELEGCFEDALQNAEHPRADGFRR